MRGEKNMRVLFLTAGKKVPSSRFRVQQYFPYLKRFGIKYTHAPLVPNRQFTYRLSGALKLLCRIRDLLRARGYDVIYFQKDLILGFPPILERLFAKVNPNIVFDFDDALFVHSKQKVIEIIKLSKVVTVGNRYLASFARKYHKDVRIIPTSVDTRRYNIKNSYEQIHEPIIGWMGSKANIYYLRKLENALNRLFKKCTFKLKLVSDYTENPFRNNRFEVILKRWSEVDEVKDLQSFDIGIMPLEDTPWTRGKCGAKILQYGACGVPAVASPVGINADIIIEGKNGFKANADKDWVVKLSKLIENADLRKRLGLQLRKTVETEYSIDVNVALLEKALHDAAR